MNTKEEKIIEVLKDIKDIYYGQAYFIDLYQNQMGYKVSNFIIEKHPDNDELLLLKCTITKEKDYIKKK